MNKADEIRKNVNNALDGYPILSAEARALREVAIAIGILADTIHEPVKPFHVVHKDESSIYPTTDFTVDWDAGYDAAQEDIKQYCNNKKNRYNAREDNDWNMGYISALIDFIEFIERMDTYEGN